MFLKYSICNLGDTNAHQYITWIFRKQSESEKYFKKCFALLVPLHFSSFSLTVSET